MEDLKKVDSFDKERMTSLEIANITGKRHDAVLRDIRNLVEQLGENDAHNFVESSYINSQNKKQPMYNLTKKGCLCLASGYRADLRMAIINRWEELELKERENMPKVPTTFAEALRLAAEQQEKIEEQQKLLDVQQPKADFYDDVVESKDALPMDRVAKTLNMGIGRNKLFEVLRGEKILMGNNTPYQKFVDLGWFRCVESKFVKPNGDVCVNIKTVVLQKGVDGIRKLLKSKKGIASLK